MPRALHAQVTGWPRVLEGTGQQYRVSVLHASSGPAGWGGHLQVGGFAGFGEIIRAGNKMWLHFFNWKTILLSYWLVCECDVNVYVYVCIFIILAIYIVTNSIHMQRVYKVYVYSLKNN